MGDRRHHNNQRLEVNIRGGVSLGRNRPQIQEKIIVQNRPQAFGSRPIKETIIVNKPITEPPRPKVEVDLKLGGGIRPQPVKETVIINNNPIIAPASTTIISQLPRQQPRLEVDLQLGGNIRPQPVQETIIVNSNPNIYLPPVAPIITETTTICNSKPNYEIDFMLGGRVAPPAVKETIVVSNPTITPAAVYSPPVATAVVTQTTMPKPQSTFEVDLKVGGGVRSPAVKETVIVSNTAITPAAVYVPTTTVVAQTSLQKPQPKLEVDFKLGGSAKTPIVKETVVVNKPLITPASVYVPPTTTTFVTQTSVPKPQPKFEVDLKLGGNVRPPIVKETIVVNKPTITPATVYVPPVPAVVTQTAVPKPQSKLEVDLTLGTGTRAPTVKETIIVNKPSITPAAVYVPPTTTTFITQTSAPKPQPKFEVDLKLGGNMRPPIVKETIVVNKPTITPAAVYVPPVSTTVLTKPQPKFEVDMKLGGAARPPPIKETIIIRNQPNTITNTTIVTPPPPKPKFELDISLGSRNPPPPVKETIIVNQSSAQTTVITQSDPPKKKSWLPKIEFGIKF